MKTRTATLSLTLTFGIPAPRAAEAQPAGKAYRLGFDTVAGPPGRSGLWHSFIEAMRGMKYVGGRNLVVRLAIPRGRPDRLPGLVGGRSSRLIPRPRWQKEPRPCHSVRSL